jgi:hypothetical protein
VAGGACSTGFVPFGTGAANGVASTSRKSACGAVSRYSTVRAPSSASTSASAANSGAPGEPISRRRSTARPKSLARTSAPSE